jgi:hypothetical protein
MPLNAHGAMRQSIHRLRSIGTLAKPRRDSGM